MIGSGATAVTLIPAMADATGHVTMLQRSPSYIIPLPAEDALSSVFRRVLGDERGYRLTRKKNIAQNVWIYKLCQRFPRQARAVIRWLNKRLLPSGFRCRHPFQSSLRPVGSAAVRRTGRRSVRDDPQGKASVVTDRIETFTETGIALESGRHLDADIVVTATGLDLLALGGVELRLDGEPVDITERLAFKGTMLSDIPNFSFAVGYTNAPWTLKVDLVAEFLCRVLTEMDRRGADVAVAENREEGMDTRPLLDFAAGYVQRSLDLWPQAGTKDPWNLQMDYYKDVAVLRDTPVDDGTLTFAAAQRRPTEPDGDLVSPD